MAVKIKLARYGKIREPYYRVVVADSRTRRSGRAIETIGRYNPKTEPSVIEIDSDRSQYWLGVGAQPTEAVVALLKVTGDWQKFKGLPGTEGTLKPQPERADRRALYEAAIAAAGGSDATDATGATTPKKKAAPKKAADEKAPKAPADAPAADAPAADAPAADAPAADAPAAEAPAADAPAADAPAAEAPAADAPAADAEKADVEKTDAS